MPIGPVTTKPRYGALITHQRDLGRKQRDVRARGVAHDAVDQVQDGQLVCGGALRGGEGGGGYGTRDLQE